MQFHSESEGDSQGKGEVWWVAVRIRGSGHCLLEDPGEGWFEEAIGTATEPQRERPSQRVLIGGAVEEEELGPASASGGAW